MGTLEDEIRDVNGRLLDRVARHERAVADHFAEDGPVWADLRASRLVSIGDRLPVPPPLVPHRLLAEFRRSDAAYRVALAHVRDVRLAGSWRRLADAFELDEPTRAYLDLDRPPRRTAFGRPDLVVHGDLLSMVEPNDGTSAGAMEDADLLGRAYERAPVIGDFLREVGAVRADVMAAVAATLREALLADGRPGDGLVVVTEFGAEIDDFHCDGFARELRRHGLRAEAHATEALDVTPSGVGVYGRPVALVYRLSGEQPDPVGNYPILHPLLEAGRDGRVLLLDDLADQIAGHKTVLALVSEAVDGGELPRPVERVLHTFVPWSRIVRDGPSTVDGERVDLLPWCRRHQQDLVAKPGSGHRGRGVTLGCEVDAAQWHEALAEAVRSPEAWLVQRLARSVHATVSVARTGRLAREETFVDYSYFITGGAVPAAVLRKHAPFGSPTRRVKRCGIGTAFLV